MDVGEPTGPTHLLLGPVAVLDGSGTPVALGGAQRRAFLAQLVLAAGRVVSIDALREGLWGDEAPPTAVKAIQVHASRLRQVLRPGELVTRAPGYLLDLPVEATDVGCFEAGCRSATEAMDAGRAEGASERWRAALALWRGDALADVADHPFAEAAVARLEEARARAIERRVAADLLLGRHAAMIGELEALVRADPLREQLWAHLMTALYRCDRQADALKAYSRARQLLVGELGIEPGPELQAVERAVLNQDLDLVAPVTVGSSPARGGTARHGLRTLTPVVGREQVFATLEEGFDRTAGGAGAVVAIRGDEGLGKTTVMAAFVGRVEASATVVVGRCREQIALPFAPWAEIARQLDDQDALELLEGLPAADETPERRRMRVFEHVVSTLRGLAAERPAVVVIDDLQWSDDATVGLVRHAIDELATTPVLFLLAWRTREVGVGHPMTGLLHQLARRDEAVVELGPLHPDDIVELLELCGHDEQGSRRLASRIHASSGGIPLFTADLVSMLSGPGGFLLEPDDIGPLIPATARTLVARRLTESGPAAASVAETCAVLNDPFEVRDVAEVMPAMSTEEVLDGLDALVRVGVLREVPSGYAFEHDTFREAVDLGLRAGRRQTLHATAFRALEGRVPPAVLVYHLEKAGSLVDDREVVAELERAGQDAAVRGAFVDAAGFFGRAVQRATVADRTRLLVAHADALWRAGEISAAKAVLAEVVAMAGTDLVSDRVLTDAVVVHATFGVDFGIDPTSLSAIERSLAAVTNPECSARLRAAAAYHHAAWGSPFSVSTSALASLRSTMVDDPSAELEVEALFAEGQVLIGSEDLERRRAVADRLVHVGRQSGSLRYLSRGLQVQALVEMSGGDLDHLASTLDELLDLAVRTGSWFHESNAWRWRIALHLATNDLEAAAAGVDELVASAGKRLEGRVFVVAGLMFLLLARGELERCLEVTDGLLSHLPPGRAGSPDRVPSDLFRLIVLNEMGRVGEARDHFAAMASYRDLDRAASVQLPGELAFTAHLAAAFGSREAADVLLPHLERRRGQLLVVAWGEAIYGSADRYAAQLRSLLDGRVDEDGFRSAVAVETTAGALAEVERTQAAWRRCAADLGHESVG